MTAVTPDIVDGRASAQRRAIGSAVPWLIAVVVALQLLPVWVLDYFPSQDGPAHVEGARVLGQWLAGDETVRHYYEVRLEPLPNYLSHLMMAALMTVVPPVVAEKLLISGYAVLFAGGALYAVRGVRRGADAVALLLLPFTFNFLLHAGFYNFNCSMAISLWALGYYLRHRERFGWPDVVAMGAMGLLMFVAHLLPLLLVGLAIGILATGDLLAQRRAGAGITWRRVLMPPLALLPFALLAIPYLDRERMAGEARDAAVGVVELTERFVVTSSLASFDRREAYVGVLFGGLLVVATGYALWRKRRERAFGFADGLLAFVAVGLVLYYTMRDGRSVQLWVPDRLNLYLHVGLVVWLAACPFGRAWRGVLATAGVATAVVLAGLHANTYTKVNAELTEVTSYRDRFEPGRTVLPLIFAPHALDTDGQPISYKLTPLAHAGGYAAVQGGVLNLSNYEGYTTHFPIVYRRHLDPLRIMDPGRLFGEIPTADLAGYERDTGGEGRVDYVLLYGLPDELADHPHVVALMEQLRRDYAIVHASPRGRVTVWERTGDRVATSR